ncbi:MAG: serine aminopeptidase domain-containing protein [Acidimicrobiia bacterium]
MSFVAGGLTVYATFRHPVGVTTDVPAAVLIAGSGPTDRNGNSRLESGPVNTLATLADWLSADGVASLRYDKLGAGRTGLGRYAAHLDSIGIAPYEQEVLTALRFLAAQAGINDQRLAVIGHSEGALFALLLADAQAKTTPQIHAIGLLEPLSLRYLDVITRQVDTQIAAQLKAGQLTTPLAARVHQTLADAVTQLRETGSVPAKLPYGLANILNASTARFLFQADQHDPAALAATLPTHTPVLVTCSNADLQVSCAEVEHLVAGLTKAHADTDFVTLTGVDHVLKVDPTGSAANYTATLPFSPQLEATLRIFVDQNL